MYLFPLIEELQLLWSGVQRFDVSSKESFNLRATCIWNVHDFLMYGLFASCVMKRHVECPPCGLATYSHSSKKLKKMVLCGSCHYLPRSHPYQHNQKKFNGEIEMRGPPTWVSTSDIVKWAEEWELWVQGPRNQTGAKHDLIHKNGIKRLNSMLQLPYSEACVSNLYIYICVTTLFDDL